MGPYSLNIQLSLFGNRMEEVSLFLFHAPSTPLVLGDPWLDGIPSITKIACMQLHLV